MSWEVHVRFCESLRVKILRATRLCKKSEIARFQFMKKHCSEFRIAKMAYVFEVSRSGYYAWLNRIPCKHTEENERLLTKIKSIHKENKRVYGSIKIKKCIEQDEPKPINHKRIERLMKENGIFSKVQKKYKATTNSPILLISLLMKDGCIWQGSWIYTVKKSLASPWTAEWQKSLFVMH